MKKIIALLLIVVTLCTFTACGEKEVPPTTTYKTYQKINYNDFNTFMTDKGIITVENTDNSSIKFERSFSVNFENKLSIIYYDLENIGVSQDLFSALIQISEVYTSEFTTTYQYENNGAHYLKDENVSTYFSYIDDTFIHAMIVTETEDEFRKFNDALINLIETLDYPMPELPDF